MDKEKLEWLKQIGAEELNQPQVINGKEFKYRVLLFNGEVMYYSESYLNETPLDKLKNKFEEWRSFFSQKDHDS